MELETKNSPNFQYYDIDTWEIIARGSIWSNSIFRKNFFIQIR